MIGIELQKSIEAAGFKMKAFKIEHLEEISAGLEELAAKGLLDRDFYKKDLSSFQYDFKDVLKDAKSVILVASPQCKSIAEFEYEGGTFQAVIPPTYVYPGINSKVKDILEKVLVRNGYSWAKPVLQLKLLAVRSSLGAYGRNNICYVEGFGSFVRLNGYITDYEFEEDSWGEAKVMESCSTCTLCIGSCPTCAIGGDRFLIYAHNCITSFNEYETPIPEWIKPEWHDSIVGCMKCQEVCPQNRRFIGTIEEKIHFDAKETEMILRGNSFENLSQETRNKLSHAGLESYYGVLPRNIRLLMKK
jgi:epoxyqueuosine reductase